MVGRGFDSAVVTASESAHVRLLTFLKLELDSGTLGTLTGALQAWLERNAAPTDGNS